MRSQLIPQRHWCGEIVNVDLAGEAPMFYGRFNLTGTGRPMVNCPRCEEPLDMLWMRRLWLVDPMPYTAAIKTAGHKLCSNCWGYQFDLIDSPPEPDEETGLMQKMALVICKACGVETIGYVTQRYVGRAREQDYLDYGNSVIGLSEALEITEGLPVKFEAPKQTTQQLMKSLGF